MKLGRKISAPVTTIIESSEMNRWFNVQEVWAYRDLFYLLVWRDIKTRYAQSVLGIGWAIIQPLFSMVVFTVVFGNMAKISSDGVPYAIFSFSALVPWTYFSGALTAATLHVPLALFTLYHGWTSQLQRHKKIARITLPLWLYVSITGVIIYYMLY